MLGPSLTESHLAIATVCTAIMIGLGFLARPGRATVLWSTMFVLWLAGAVGAVVATETGMNALWLIAVGAMFATPALVWSGLRAHRGARRTYAWVAVVIAAVSITLLLVGVGAPGFHVFGRSLFLASALMNIAVLVELFRPPLHARGVAIPLVLVSGAWIVLGAVGVVAGAMDIQENYALLTQSNSLAAMVYQVCALVTLLFLSRTIPTTAPFTGAAAFDVSARDRLQRAEAAGEHNWILLDVRLDDAADLRAAIGEIGFAQVSGRFQAAVRTAFPADADIGVIDDGRAIVLVARTSSTVRSGIRQLMEELVHSARDSAEVLHVSASVGWADVTTSGYDLDDLMAAASAHTAAAMAEGGGRWKRD